MTTSGIAPHTNKPPKTYQDFQSEYPKLAAAWDLIREAGADGPIDAHTRHLLKIAVAIGALRESATHSAVRKARAAGISEAEIAQIVALAASTLGLPSTVMAWTWVRKTAKNADTSLDADEPRSE